MRFSSIFRSRWSRGPDFEGPRGSGGRFWPRGLILGSRTPRGSISAIFGFLGLFGVDFPLQNGQKSAIFAHLDFHTNPREEMAKKVDFGGSKWARKPFFGGVSLDFGDRAKLGPF